MVVAPLAAVVPVPVEGVVVDAGVAPLLVAAVAAVADPLKQLVEPEPNEKEEYIKGGQYTPLPC